MGTQPGRSAPSDAEHRKVRSYAEHGSDQSFTLHLRKAIDLQALIDAMTQAVR